MQRRERDHDLLAGHGHRHRPEDRHPLRRRQRRGLCGGCAQLLSIQPGSELRPKHVVAVLHGVVGLAGTVLAVELLDLVGEHRDRGPGVGQLQLRIALQRLRHLRQLVEHEVAEAVDRQLAERIRPPLAPCLHLEVAGAEQVVPVAGVGQRVRFDQALLEVALDERNVLGDIGQLVVVDPRQRAQRVVGEQHRVPHVAPAQPQREVEDVPGGQLAPFAGGHLVDCAVQGALGADTGVAVGQIAFRRLLPARAVRITGEHELLADDVQRAALVGEPAERGHRAHQIVAGERLLAALAVEAIDRGIELAAQFLKVVAHAGGLARVEAEGPHRSLAGGLPLQGRRRRLQETTQTGRDDALVQRQRQRLQCGAGLLQAHGTLLQGPTDRHAGEVVLIGPTPTQARRRRHRRTHQRLAIDDVEHRLPALGVVVGKPGFPQGATPGCGSHRAALSAQFLGAAVQGTGQDGHRDPVDETGALAGMGVVDPRARAFGAQDGAVAGLDRCTDEACRGTHGALLRLPRRHRRCRTQQRQQNQGRARTPRPR